MFEQDNLPARSFWWHWKRGFVRLWQLYLVGFVIWFALDAIRAAEVLPTPALVVVDLAIILALLLLLPPYVSVLIPVAEQGAAQKDQRLRPLVDELARRDGVDWGRHWISQIDGLLQAGQWEEAAREYRERLGVTWDEAHRIVSEWSNNEAERKLLALLRHLKETPTPPVAAGEK